MSRIALVVAVLFIAGCGHDHPGAPGQAGELTPVSVTHFTEQAELFVEFEPLRAGEDSQVAAHLTRLADFKPVGEGRLILTLSGGGQAEERFEAAAPASPGIFKPVVRPRVAGARTLAITLETNGIRDTHELGQVTVYANRQAAIADKKAASDEAGRITFLKEQQWQVDFAAAPAALQPLRATVAATGIVQGSAAGSAQVVAPVAGQVVAPGGTFPNVGMKVARGDVIFGIVPRLAGDTDVATLRLAFEKARIQHERGQKEVARLEQLYREEAIAERRVIAARYEEALARAELKTAQERLAPYGGGAQAGTGVLVRAPVSGVIVEFALAQGASVNEGQPVVRLADPSRLWLEVRVAEADAARIMDVQGAWIRAPGSEQPFALEVGRNARLVAFGQALDPVTRTVPLILEFQSPGAGVRIGTAVQVEIWIGDGGRKLAVPASALVEEGGQSVVFVQRSGETFERRIVSTGVRDGASIEVRAGIKPGERVVTRGAYLVRLAAASPKAAGEGHVH